MLQIIQIPGSKSILQRMMVLIAHCRSDITLKNYNPCTDVLELEAALATFGYQVSREGDTASFRFDPDAHKSSRHLYMFQGSATAFRLWLSLLANQAGISSQIRLSDILVQRGFQPLQSTLQDMGAKISLHAGCLKISGTNLPGGIHELQGTLSSQFHSSLILAAPFMQAPLSLPLKEDQVSMPYIRLSLGLLKLCNGSFREADGQLIISQKKLSLPEEFMVDADLSTAAYYAVQGALSVDGVSMILPRTPALPQADGLVFELLTRMGARVNWQQDVCTVLPGKLRGIDICLKDAPDLMPVLSVLALFAGSPSLISGIARLAFKESNRLMGICKAFNLLGAGYERGEDTLVIRPLGERPIAATELDTQEDHRLVMAFSLLRSRFPQISLKETASLSKSLPL